MTFDLPGYAATCVGGAGEPRVLLLHGFTGDRRDWTPWPGNGPPALAVDLPGHGGSPDPQGDYGAEIVRLLEVLPASIDRVAGYSLGGRVALSLLAAAPRRFAAAVVVSAHPGLDDAAERAARRAADRRWIDMLRHQGIGTFVDAWEAQPLFASQQRLCAEALDCQRARRLAQRPEGLARSLECLGLGEMPSTWPALARYAGRLDWVVGELDGKFAAIAREVVRQRPATALHLLPGIGHNGLLEAPERICDIAASAAGAN